MLRSRWTPSSLLRRCSSFVTHALHTRWGVGQSSSEVGVILAYGLSALPLALLNNIWVTYNYPFFVGGPLRDSSLFIWVQIVFLIWNSINDPLFGWISDHTPLGGGGGAARKGAAAAVHPSLRRIRHIRLGGYLLGAAFLFAWFPWSMTTPWVAAAHFLISLCAYDGALTYMEVNHSSLLADISVNAQTRAWCNSASSLFSILGSLSSFAGHMLYTSSVSSSDSSGSGGSGGMHHDGQAPWPFKLFCMALVGLCVPALEISCRYIDAWARSQHHAVGESMHLSPPTIALQDRSSSDRKSHRQHSGSEAGSAAERGALLESNASASSVTESIVQVRVAPASPSLKSLGGTPSGSVGPASQPSSPAAASSSAAAAAAPLTFLLFLRQISAHRNFALFCGIRLLQVFLCTFEKNHLSSFLAVLLGAHLSQASQAALISLSFICPHLLLLLTSVWQSQLGGVYSIIRGLFLTKVCAAIFTLATLMMATSGQPGGIGSFASAAASSGSAPASAAAAGSIDASSTDSSASSWSWSLLPYLLVLYLCGSRVVTECVCRLIPLVTSGLVDEDRVLHLRPSSMAATLIGTSSLLAKPGESLAPMLGWKVINMIGGAGGAAGAGAGEENAATAAGEATTDARKAGLLYLLLTLPLLTVGIQLMLWSAFTLKGAYLRHISQRVKELEGSSENDDQEATLQISDEEMRKDKS